jgi:SWI/SNF-related matrix-associated actin-dependent regulator 1 of chromatin subfamily A
MDCAKVKALLELIREYQANGDRTLVFTRFAKVIEILGECLASEGIEYLSLQGNTDVSYRQELINEFTANETIPVFLLTTGSGGTGINLTAANKVVIFDQSDNPQDDIQAENRAHRLGQKRAVEIVRLISAGTVEELVYKACQKKLELANKVTGWSTAEMTSGEMEAAVKSELLRQAVTTPPNGD